MPVWPREKKKLCPTKGERALRLLTQSSSDPEGTEGPKGTSPSGPWSLGGREDRACSLPSSPSSFSSCHLVEAMPCALMGM